MKISEKQLVALLMDTKTLCNALLHDSEKLKIDDLRITDLIVTVCNLIGEIYRQQSEELKEVDKCQ